MFISKRCCLLYRKISSNTQPYSKAVKSCLLWYLFSLKTHGCLTQTGLPGLYFIFSLVPVATHPHQRSHLLFLNATLFSFCTPARRSIPPNKKTGPELPGTLCKDVFLTVLKCLRVDFSFKLQSDALHTHTLRLAVCASSCCLAAEEET